MDYKDKVIKWATDLHAKASEIAVKHFPKDKDRLTTPDCYMEDLLEGVRIRLDHLHAENANLLFQQEQIDSGDYNTPFRQEEKNLEEFSQRLDETMESFRRDAEPALPVEEYVTISQCAFRPHPIIVCGH